jgi:hypothetical protein
MGRSGRSKSSRQTPTAKLQNRNQSKRKAYIISRTENAVLFKLRKEHKTN